MLKQFSKTGSIPRHLLITSGYTVEAVQGIPGHLLFFFFLRDICEETLLTEPFCTHVWLSFSLQCLDNVLKPA